MFTEYQNKSVGLTARLAKSHYVVGYLSSIYVQLDNCEQYLS